MPTYTYKCTKGHEFEIVEKITDSPLTACLMEEEYNPSEYTSLCMAKVERLITRTSFVLKGKGWAKDGYQKS